MSDPTWLAAGRTHVWMPYAQMKTAPRPIPIVATEGSFLIRADGSRLIDGLASWWTACHGYNHPVMVEAVTRQLHTMPHVMLGGIQHPQVARLAQRLAQLAPGDLNHVFFTDSGSVAVEVAMKMAFQFWKNQGQARRTQFVAFRHAYHGDTMGAMSVCDPDNSMHAHFQGYLPQQFYCELPDSPARVAALSAFLRQHADQVAAVVIEPLVQGAGGMKFHEPAVLREVRSACDQAGVLLIADEIATGFGRTGTLFACEQGPIVPDIMCVGKALTGGMMTLAATLASERVYRAFLDDDPTFALMHGPTYMGNPLACAAANASLDLFEREPRVEQARAMESRLRDGLAPCSALGQVCDVRSKGAVGVIQVDCLRHLERLRAACVDARIWLRPFRDMIYLTPPLNIEPRLLDELCTRTVEVVRAWAQWG